MTFRELLQIEIWSKRTTRKILFGIGFVAVGIVVFDMATRFWLTPMERIAGREALASIDVLQVADDAQFDTVDQQAKDKVEVAEQKSLTLRDQAIAFGLSSYLRGVEFRRQEQKMRSSSDERLRKLALPENPPVAKILGQSHNELGQNLHSVLD